MPPIEPDWPVDGRIGAFATTRGEGDAPESVAGVRRLPSRPRWLDQVHGSRVIGPTEWRPGVEADAAWTDRPGEVLAIKTADCLPILLAERGGALVAGVHGGWRSLAGGILPRVLSALPAEGRDLRAWIGPAICRRCYQVGDDVRDAFVSEDATLAAAFEADGDRWRADLKWIAAQQLRGAGVEVFDCRRCTYEEVDTFYSFRREGKTGRLASVIWKSR
jgi:hypothetical protein